MYLNKIVILLLIILSFTSCKKRENGYTIYHIREGVHSSTISYRNLLKDNVHFDCKFDESAIYESIDPANQYDINKLYGFSECNKHHQQASARFGWRWVNNELEIVTYVYHGGKRLMEKHIKNVSLNESHEYQITIMDDYYIFRVDDVEVTEIRDGCDGLGHYYILYPYFGGDEVAPHDIYIYLRNYR